MTGKENLTNSQFSSIDELNVDECLDSSKSYTCSVRVWQIKYWRYLKISCRTVASFDTIIYHFKIFSMSLKPPINTKD